MPLTFVVGTKTDLAFKRDVSYDEGQSLARELGAFYFEVSTAINTNVSSLFESAVSRILEGIHEPFSFPDNAGNSLDEEEEAED